MALGTGLGIAFVLLAVAAGAHSGIGDARAVLDATHLPPLLTLPGERVELRYDVHCLPAGDEAEASPCAIRGRVFVRPGTRGAYRELPLRLDEGAAEGRYVAAVPDVLASAPNGFSYYAVLDDATSRTTLTLPAGGSRSPQRSLPLVAPTIVPLGEHAFGATRKADARVFSASWGGGAADVGLESGPNLTPTGGSSFDVAPDGVVHVLDEIHRRVLRRSADGSMLSSAELGIDGTLADIAIGPDDTTYVLETARTDHRPLLRAFGRSGEPRGSVEIGERTASQVRIGPDGPIVLGQPSSQWVPADVGAPSAASASPATVGRPGRTLPGGREVVVLRFGSEVRALVIGADGVRRSWRVTSATPLAEVQLAEPIGVRLLLVVRVYTDGRDEFVALLLGPHGLLENVSLDSADWAETAPLARFRLVGSSLYQLGSTTRGVFVDRYDLGRAR